MEGRVQALETASARVAPAADFTSALPRLAENLRSTASSRRSSVL